MDGALAVLETALVALDTADLSALSDGAVHRHLLTVTDALSSLQATQARLAAQWAARGVWREDGSRSAGARLARETRVRRASANRVIHRGVALAGMPETAAALAAGRINCDHVDLLAAANTAPRRELFVRDESMLVGFCWRLPLWEAETAVRYWVDRVDAVNGDDDGPEPAWTNRQAHSHRGIDGEMHIGAVLDPVGAAMFLAVWDRIDNQFRLDDEQTLTDGVVARTRAQRRADALVEMAIRAGADNKSGRRPRPLITVTIGDESFRRLCELSNGTVIKPGQLVPYLTGSDVHSIIFDGPFHAIAASPARRFTGLLRRAIEVRDRRCQHPASDGDPIDRCDVDHITPHNQGGITCQCNGQLMEQGRNRDPNRRRLTAADITIWHDDPTTIATRNRINALITANNPPAAP